jgi:uncharacterized membrane protein (UPF0136 family)
MTPFVIETTEIYYFVFGVLTLLGGLVAFWKTKSIQSLALGLVCGLTLVAAGFLVHYGESHVEYLTPGLILGLLATAGLSGQYIPKVMVNRAPLDVIAMAILSGIGMVLTLIAFAKK